MLLNDTHFCIYDYDQTARIVTVELLQTPPENSTDYTTIMHLMEVEDIALILKNAADRRAVTFENLFNGDMPSHDKFKLYNIIEGPNGEVVKDDPENTSTI